RQGDEEAADRARITIGIVDDDDLAAGGIAPDAPEQLAVGTDHRDYLRAIGPEHDSACLAAHDLGPDIARAVAEAVELVVTHELLAARIADDEPAGLHDDGAAAFLHLAALGTEVVDVAWSLRSRIRRDRCERCCGRRRDRRKRSRDG